VVREYNDRLAEVPQQRDHLDVVGRTVLDGQPMELRKFVSESANLGIS